MILCLNVVTLCDESTTCSKWNVWQKHVLKQQRGKTSSELEQFLNGLSEGICVVIRQGRRFKKLDLFMIGQWKQKLFTTARKKHKKRGIPQYVISQIIEVTSQNMEYKWLLVLNHVYTSCMLRLFDEIHFCFNFLVCSLNEMANKCSCFTSLYWRNIVSWVFSTPQASV